MSFELCLKQKTSDSLRIQTKNLYPFLVLSLIHHMTLSNPFYYQFLTNHKKITYVYFPNLEASIRQVTVSRKSVIQLCSGNTYTYLLSQKNPLLKRGILSFCNNLYQSSLFKSSASSLKD